MTASPPQPQARDHRVDFLRGLALAAIFVNHVPGNLYSYVTHTNFGFSDAAEVFVMLAGLASAYAYFARFERGERWEASLKAWRRAGVLYVSHVFTTVVGIAIFCAAAIYFAKPGYLDDSIDYVNLKHVFEDPVRSFTGIVVMGHQLGYFNILPMYMGLLLMLPLMMWLAAKSLKLLLACSLIVWFLSGWFVIDLPNYPKEGGWFFNPIAWQLLFVIGFILGQWQREGRRFPYSPALFWISAAYLAIAIFWVKFDWWRFQPQLPFPRTVWDFDKTYVSFPRLFHVLALGYVVMMSPLGDWMRRISPANPLTAMGRHSLPVFCAGTLLSIMGTIARHEWGGGFIQDTVIVAVGLAVQMLLAVMLDARKPPPMKREVRNVVPTPAL